MRDLAIADLRHRLLIEVPRDESDDAGGILRTYIAKSHVWAAIETIQGKQEFLTDRRTINITHKITLRWRDDVNLNVRLRLQDRCFLIVTFWPQRDRKTYLICFCEEVTA